MTEKGPYAVRVCSRCGCVMMVGKAPFYIVNIEAISGYDPEEFEEADLEKDLRKEIGDLCRKLESVTQEDAEASVYRRMSFFLCPACHKAYLADPSQRGITRVSTDPDRRV